jgi:hypothetical protein
MPQSLAKNLIHLIHSTKDRASCLSPVIQDGLFAYKAGILKWNSPALLIGGVADHVHVLFCLSKKHALAKVIEEVITYSEYGTPSTLSYHFFSFRDRWCSRKGSKAEEYDSAGPARRFARLHRPPDRTLGPPSP